VKLSSAIVAALLACPQIALAAGSDRSQTCVAASDRGQEQRDKGHLLEARASFRQCASDECPAMLRKDCATWLEDVDRNLPTVVLGAKDAHGSDLLAVKILVDGTPHQEELESGRAIALDPGPHVFRFEHPPDAPVELTAVLRMGERNRGIIGTFGPPPAPPPPQPALIAAAHVEPPVDLPPPRRSRISPWGWVLGGVGLGALGSFAYFGATGLSEKSTLRSQCGSSCTDEQVSPLKTRYIAADVSLGVGVLALAAAAWIILHPSLDEPKAGAVSAAPGGLQIRF
jgi:hypothetical protein